MYVMFYTTRVSDPRNSGEHIDTDHYVICASEQGARDHYHTLLANVDEVYCAGVAKITDAATEPHWSE